MELRPGYKQTELGVIPEDWKVKDLRSILNQGRLGGNYPNQDRETNYPLMKMGNIGRGNIELGKVEYISAGHIPDEKDRLQFGDLLFNTRNTLDLVGKVAIWRNELPVAYYNSNRMRLDFEPEEISSKFFSNYVFNSIGCLSRLRAIATGTTSVAAIYTRDLLQLSFPVPPKSEQEAIAAALSDVDALISGLDQLIAKKRDLKQAAMQQLLTGQQRLPGFSGEWEVKRLGDICKITTGKKDVNEGNPQGSYPFFTCSRTHTFSDSYSFDTEAILIAGNGDVGTLHYYNGKFEAYQRTYVLSGFCVPTNYLLQYLGKYLIPSLVVDKIGSSIPYIKLGNLKDFGLGVPKNSTETKAIANVFTDMDAEITALEQRRDKTRDLKQGMMQELLTGRIRLI